MKELYNNPFKLRFFELTVTHSQFCIERGRAATFLNLTEVPESALTDKSRQQFHMSYLLSTLDHFPVPFTATSAETYWVNMSTVQSTGTDEQGHTEDPNVEATGQRHAPAALPPRKSPVHIM